MPKSVAVLMGGSSVEREVSLASGAACADALLDAAVDVEVGHGQLLREQLSHGGLARGAVADQDDLQERVFRWVWSDSHLSGY